MARTQPALVTAATLAASCALAQTDAPSAGTQNNGRGTASEHATGVQSSPGTSGISPASGTITAQTRNQWLASQFRGMTVVGSDDAKIGVVDDILFDHTGTVKGVVIGAGGFLGIGARQVAFPLAEFTIVAGNDGAAEQLKLAKRKEQLAATPEFRPHDPRRAPAAARPTTSGQASE